MLLRKSPSGPEAFSAEYLDGGTLRAESDGDVETVVGTTPGQLWYWNGSLWLPTSDAPTDGEGPVWDADAGDYRFQSVGAGALEYFDRTHDPVALFNFNDTLADQSGNGLDLTLSAGSAGFADVVPGKRGLFVWEQARYMTAAAAPLLQIAGDLTIEAIVQQDVNPISADQTLVTYNGPTENESDNTLYQVNFQATGSFTSTRNLSYVSEHGAGVNDTYSSSGTAVSLGCIHNILFLALRRQAGVLQFFANGRPLGNASAAITAPTGGTGANTRLVVGAPGTSQTAGDQLLIFSLKIIARALTDAEIKAEYNRTVGRAFGVLS